MKRQIDVYDLGRSQYRPVWDLQKRAQQLLIRKKRGELSSHEDLNDFLFFVEHPHVYTLGKSGDSANLLKTLSELSDLDAEYIEIDRGGDITYHGPGQIVGYPILDLDQHFTDIHKYLRYLEEIVIRTCADFGIKAGRIEGLTGVWIGDKKICAMGIRCSRWVTMHGFALNVNTDLNYFQNIVPCGISDKEVTSLSECTGKQIDEHVVKEKLLNHFADLFDVEINKHDSIPEPYSQFLYL
ncbi:lipoyl(octanoyl) transferase LipB [Rhodohalobacter sulfatireducens]|uniref:Octanoyltransferase n=1 Tax=Rhodohalobacter sulfatireducens TaxID=2911366 RepID=A0ABS9K843_9BACT|nr:lipoyl(octanoyl) transferase LipB [Rhodohalobacter sulfatireducens]MCG2587020.1 lipoyl(octanoyl) transferase LipB [Rhodohalobacter sulfatireducens]